MEIQKAAPLPRMPLKDLKPGDTFTYGDETNLYLLLDPGDLNDSEEYWVTNLSSGEVLVFESDTVVKVLKAKVVIL